MRSSVRSRLAPPIFNNLDDPGRKGQKRGDEKPSPYATERYCLKGNGAGALNGVTRHHSLAHPASQDLRKESQAGELLEFNPEPGARLNLTGAIPFQRMPTR